MSKEKKKQDKKAIWVPEDLHHDIKLEATRQRLTMWEYIMQLIRGRGKDLNEQE